MPKLGEITAERYGFMKLRDISWFSEATSTKGLAEGGVYLLSGAEGSGKTNLALQISADLAIQGYKVLYLALEQSASELKHRVDDLILPGRASQAETAEDLPPDDFKDALKKIGKKVQSEEKDENERQRVYSHFYVDSSISGMEGLPDFLARQVLKQGGPYEGTNLLVVDSIQALGTAPTSSKPYQRLFEFNRWAKESGITPLLLGQITKGGAIAGPRSLAHNVDCVLYLRKAMRLRPLFVPKNRFGPERHEPLTLTINRFGCLEKSKHTKAKASYAFGFLAEDLIEVQALVKLPKYGERAGIKAPYLPRQKLSQLVGIISGMQDIDISDLTFEINCNLPGGRQYKTMLDLPLAVSMLSSYFQQGIPLGSLFVGEVDLFQNIRPIPDASCEALAAVLTDTDDHPMARRLEKVYASEDTCSKLGDALQTAGRSLSLISVKTLEELVQQLWPEVV